MINRGIGCGDSDDFGFSFPYLYDQGGVAIEPWHISHGETSQEMQKQLTPQDLQQIWQQYPFLGIGAVVENLDTLYTQYIINTSLYKATE